MRYTDKCPYIRKNKIVRENVHDSVILYAIFYLTLQIFFDRLYDNLRPERNLYDIQKSSERGASGFKLDTISCIGAFK